MSSLNEHIHRVERAKETYNETLAELRGTGKRAADMGIEGLHNLQPEDEHIVSNRPTPSEGVAETLMARGRRLVYNYVNEMFDKSDPAFDFPFTDENVYVVWFSKTLRNHKMLISTSLSDGKYYEVTYNGEKAETYLDVFVRVDHKRVSD